MLYDKKLPSLADKIMAEAEEAIREAQKTVKKRGSGRTSKNTKTTKKYAKKK